MTKKPKPKKKRRINYKAVSKKLAGCVAFALKYAKHLSRGSGVMMTIKKDPKTGAKRVVPGKRWEDDFMDALDAYGYVIDRDAYFKSAAGKRRQSGGLS